MASILGIHSNVDGGNKTGGHAWISVTENGATTTYGLWPDAHPNVPDNGKGSDIRVGMEDYEIAKASRYYELNQTQSTQLRGLIAQNKTWKYQFNCSSWATYVVKQVMKEDIAAEDWWVLGIKTPRQLGTAIREMEMKDPTSKYKPKTLVDVPDRSSSGSSFL